MTTSEHFVGNAKSGTKDDLCDIAERVVGWAHDNMEVEAYVSRNIENDIIAYNGGIESLSFAESMGVGIRVIREKRVGFAYVASFAPDAVREAFEDACDNALFASVDEYAGLATPDGVVPVKMDLWEKGLETFSPEKKIALALELERSTKSKDARIRTVELANYGDGRGEFALATTTGIRAESRSAVSYVSVSAIAGEGDDAHTGAGYSVRRDPTCIDIDEAATDAVLRSTRLLGATKPKSQKLTAVFDTHATPAILGALATALNGESVAKGRSFFAESLDQSVAMHTFTLIDDPTDLRAYSASPFDGEGLASRKNVLIENGVLREFLYDTYAARRANRKSNGACARSGYQSGPHAAARALSLQPGEKSQEELIAGIDFGVFVQSTMGSTTGGINPISGDVSLGAEGMMIVEGKLAYPVREFTIAANIKDMLQHIGDIGADVTWLPGSIAGVSLVVHDMALAGN